MRAPLKRLLFPVIVPAVVAGIALPAPAQSTAEAGGAISTVMGHRSIWMADSTRFEACSVQRAMNGAEDFAMHIIEPVRGLLNRTGSPCPRQPPGPREWRAEVLVDSLRFTDSTANVYVTVLRGELIHRENYTLARDPLSPAFMPIRDVRLWGHGQFYQGGSFSGPPR